MVITAVGSVVGCSTGRNEGFGTTATWKLRRRGEWCGRSILQGVDSSSSRIAINAAAAGRRSNVFVSLCMTFPSRFIRLSGI